MFRVLCVSLLIFTITIRSNIVMSPYLMGVTTNSVYVLVECTTTDQVTVQYGLTTSYGMSAVTELYSATLASPVTYVHKIKLTGLSADSVYHFKATQLTTSSTDSYFRSAPLPGKSFRFCWEADMRTNTAPHDQIAALINTANPAFLLQGGDVCASATYAIFKSEFFRTNELNLISHVPFFWSPGNHETWSTNTKAFSKAPQSNSGIEDYYSFDYGDIHFLILNTQVTYTVGSAQYNYAQTDLSTSTKPWKIVVMHIPAYTAGGTGAHTEDANLILMSKNVFEPNKVDLVLTGHNHFYQHNKVNAIHHVTIGSAGAPLYPVASASYTVSSVSDYCYGIFDFKPSSLKMTVYNNVNKFLDSLTLSKPTSVKDENASLAKFALAQNYPNPFNPVTTINYQIERDGLVTLKIYDMLGKEIASLVNEIKSSGSYFATFNGANLPSGIYFSELRSGLSRQTNKIVLMK